MPPPHAAGPSVGALPGELLVRLETSVRPSIVVGPCRPRFGQLSGLTRNSTQVRGCAQIGIGSATELRFITPRHVSCPRSTFRGIRPPSYFSRNGLSHTLAAPNSKSVPDIWPLTPFVPGGRERSGRGKRTTRRCSATLVISQFATRLSTALIFRFLQISGGTLRHIWLERPGGRGGVPGGLPAPARAVTMAHRCLC